MSSHLFHLLRHWYPARDEQQWVLGTVFRTQGSAYRKAGAFMLFNDGGQKFGLLSGGCLEADLHKKAMQCLAEEKAVILKYDSSDEDDLTFQLGIGCGGVVEILLQPLTEKTEYLNLEAVYTQLKVRKSVVYKQRLPDISDSSAISVLGSDERQQAAKLVEEEGRQWLVTSISPLPHLLIVGGGVDARPVANIANQLGWEVSLVDPRPANARREYFSTVDRISRLQLKALVSEEWFATVSAAIVMSHNVELDANALKALCGRPIDYCALLGPLHRRDQVLELAGLSSDDFPYGLAGPAGLDVGAELPESIALSILAECHAAICGRNALSLSGVV